ncbi:MAG: hypothetical protein JW757_03515 [Anaerolineales bacterium]|nr:hypothetical protein [Anaerolineales bacterium]
MAENEILTAATLDWLLEEDNPGVRYLALCDLLELRSDHPDLVKARALAHQEGPIARVLDEINPEGYWSKPGPGYTPKYFSTVWSLILLGQLGASVDIDARIGTACEYLLDHALTEYGQFSASGSPGGTVDCLQGNLCTAMLDLGYQDARMEKAFEWMARTVTGEGVAPLGTTGTPLRYYSGKIGPDFACGANDKLACAWGAVKVMLAFSKLPRVQRTPLIKGAIERGVDFLFSVDPADATYPHGYAPRPSGNWWKFGFPVFYVTDLLQNVETLVRLGYGQDPRLQNALQVVWENQDSEGRWPLEYSYSGKTWLDFGEKKQPNKWVTLRAAWVLKNAG